MPTNYAHVYIVCDGEEAPARLMGAVITFSAPEYHTSNSTSNTNTMYFYAKYTFAIDDVCPLMLLHRLLLSDERIITRIIFCGCNNAGLGRR